MTEDIEPIQMRDRDGSAFGRDLAKLRAAASITITNADYRLQQRISDPFIALVSVPALACCELFVALLCSPGAVRYGLIDLRSC
jgi:hypothetical protein